MNKRRKKKTLNRAAAYPVGNGLMYVPSGQQQGVLGQTFYGSKANIPVGQSALFSPGIPLAPQPNLNPSGYPIQWKFMPAQNTFPVDRSSGNPDIPSFQQLRNLAKLYNGVTLCERCWFDLVPRMQLKISLKPEYVADGADDKDYQKEISYFKTWFEKPDKMHDLHSWIRMCLREQTQVDELYIYKRKKRGGGLYALELIAGDQMKPLLDDWGKIPQPPSYAYQQYPWGIPGAWFRSDEMIHYQESPAADNPYGQSRVERIILLVNQALRKQKKDLSHFTEGNIPQGMMKVPADATWTPDQIDAFEQAWNALLAGNASQQVRMRFTQPGMEYQAFEQYQLDPMFDKFLVNICVSAYGLSMQDLGFTEDIHKSSGDSQQNVTYRRTVDPLAMVYASFITQSINNDFDPDFHGEMFEATFTGFDEEEDVSELSGAYSTLVSSGILGISNAGKLLKLPEDPNAPYIGRVILSKNGPIFLDEIASGKMSNPADTQQLTENEEEDDEETPTNAGTTQKKQSEEKPNKKEEDDDSEGKEQPEEKRYTIGELLQLLSQQGQTQTANQENGTHLERSEETPVVTGATRARNSENVATSSDDATQDYKRWRSRAIDDVKAARPFRGFTTTLIPPTIHKWISDELVECTTPDQVRDVFARARDTSFLAEAVTGKSGGVQSSSNLLWRNRLPI